jgi:predicted PurR-regulated permease PerM
MPVKDFVADPDPHAKSRFQFPWNITPPIALAIFLGYGLVLSIGALGRAVAIVIVAATIANALAPLANFLSRHMPRGIAVAVIFLCLVAAAALVGWLIIPPLMSQASQFIDQFPKRLDSIKQHINQIAPISHLASRFASLFSSAATSAIRFLATLGSSLMAGVLVLFLSLYWLVSMPKLIKSVDSLFPERKAQRVCDLLRKMGDAMGGYVRASLLDACATSVLTYIGLLLVGLDFALPLAGLMFIGEFIPLIGTWAAGVPGVLIALTQSPMTAVWVVIVYVGVQQIEGHLLVPNIMKSQVNIPQWLVLIAIFVGGLLGGILGVLAAVPASGALSVIVTEWAAPEFRQWTGASKRPGL